MDGIRHRRRPQKKLIDAARHLGSGDKGEAAQDLVAFGVDPAAAREFAPPPEDFEVWPENWETVQMFLRCETQWRWSGGMAVIRTGLDYTAVNSLLDRLLPRPRRASVFDGITLMERETLIMQAEDRQ